MIAERVRQMSVEEFLDFAESSEESYEYLDGELYEMSGGKLNHFLIIKRIILLLEALLANSDCETVPNGMLVRVGESSLVAPDVSVVCGAPETEADTRILLNPIVVVEVLSPSSIDHDRVVKRDFYLSVESIQAYLIVDQHRMFAELHTRGDAGWQLRTFTQTEDEISLEALDCRLALRDIYQRITFES